MSENAPLQPIYGLTRKVAVGTSAANINIVDWNQDGRGYTQVLITNTANGMFFINFSEDAHAAEIDKDLPIIAGAPFTLTRNQADTTFSVTGTVAGGFVWITPIIGD